MPSADVEPSTPSFETLGLSAAGLEALRRAGYSTPTPIQAAAIPVVLSGRDVIGCAATGTGKTAAFVLPILDRLAGKSGTRALVLAPTRELAAQLAQQVDRFVSDRRLRSATLIGGVPMHTQLAALERQPQIVIGTPGRTVDHLEKGNLAVSDLEVLVLDEADRMLDLGFKPQLTRILKLLPRDRQSLLFSATIGGEVASFARTHLRDPARLEVTPSGTTAERALQRLYQVAPNEKLALLLALLSDDDASTLVFTRNRQRADKIARAVAKAGYPVESLHSDRSQGQRRHALEGFRRGKYRVLVATDIAARGLDVQEIGHVVNFDLPHDPQDYVHRIGRTARAAAAGLASSFAAPDDAGLLAEIEQVTRSPVPRVEVPRTHRIFNAFLEEAARKQADPGPPQKTPRAAAREPGQPLGRHARTHQKKPPKP